MTATITPFPQRERENWQETAPDTLRLVTELYTARLNAVAFAQQIIEYANIDLKGDATLSLMGQRYMEIARGL
jgi:hypothetical protein